MYLILVCILSLFSAFYNLNGKALSPWDESRNAVNALEMLENHDWFNYYYAGSLDLWNAKPPLFIWLLCLSFKLFGKTIFALRIIPAIASVISLIVIFKTVKIFIDENKALLCCFILFTCKGFFGGHTARSGDFDALLTLFLLLSIYHFLQYLVNKKEDSIVYFFLFTGLAFFTKGPSCLLFLPTIILFIFLNKQKHTIVINRKFIYGIFIFLFFPLLYFIIQIKYGITSEITNGITNTNSSLGTLFLYDTIHRIIGSHTFTEHTWDAFIVYLDVYFFIWYIFFYCTIILFIFKKLKLNNQLVLFSVLSIAIIGVFFTFMANQKHWYLMPLFPFIAIVTAYGISFLINYNKWMFIPVIILAIISLTTQCFYLNEKIAPPPLITNNTELLKQAKKINCIGITEQNILCYLYFLNENLHFPENKNDLHGLIIADRKSIKSNVSNLEKIIYQDDDYLISIASD